MQLDRKRRKELQEWKIALGHREGDHEDPANLSYTVILGGTHLNKTKYTNYDDMPLMLSVPDVASVLGISRAGAYELVRSDGFPSLRIGFPHRRTERKSL